MSHYYFGVEIEVIAKPHVVNNKISDYEDACDFYYERLAAIMRNEGLNTQAERRREKYKSRCDVRRWTVMRDTSLEHPKSCGSAIAYEAVSPILDSRKAWAAAIDTFWRAHNTLLSTPHKSVKSGLHIHISPGDSLGNRSRFHLDDYKAIAFGTVFFDAYIQDLLPVSRRENKYCMPNTKQSKYLLGKSIDHVKRQLESVKNPRDLIKVMQGNDLKKRRYVLWNFENIACKEGHQPGSESGTVEFRGGPCVRKRSRTKKWIAFTIAFINLCRTEFLAVNRLHPPEREKDVLVSYDRPSIFDFYKLIKKHATKFQLRAYLPDNWESMNESHNEDSDDKIERGSMFVATG